MPKLGSHQSISGGVENAVLAAAKLGFDCVQLFSKNSNQWRAKAIDEQSAKKFQEALAETGLVAPLIHDSYLINLASPNEELYAKSFAAFCDELVRASTLGVSWVVTHPGAHTTDTVENGIDRIAKAFGDVLKKTPKEAGILIETTAGQGTCLGRRFEEIAAMLNANKKYAARMGVCIDTCHVFAAGYDISTREGYEKTMDEFDRVIGLERVKAFHLNDSVKECGQRVDRHAHIGHGKIGSAPFGWILNDPRFAELPMYLETPKGDTEADGEMLDWDIVNLRVLRDLLK
ncbi:MAG: deoxyribonuclease IV [Thermoguttaceae bacterium]|nr:deoxyribonuclease IV [Thermoguttaceae bacterium]